MACELHLSEAVKKKKRGKLGSSLNSGLTLTLGKLVLVSGS